MTNRDKYCDAAKAQLEPNIFKHSLAVEACMGALYDYFQTQHQLGADEPSRDDWTLAGLIHDIDYSGEYKAGHPKHTATVLKKYGLDLSTTVDHIVKAHAPDLTGMQPQTKADWSIFCVDSLTGLIVAVALIYPTKKLADVKLSSVLKRFLKQPRFAAGTRREDVAKCSLPNGLNLPLEKFVEISL
ncbi:MAG: HD domain-containing protein, partial [Patescibacteria group bacterium]|nr:HD domain-containing protein [Patescibacteria group bacterium]